MIAFELHGYVTCLLQQINTKLDLSQTRFEVLKTGRAPQWIYFGPPVHKAYLEILSACFIVFQDTIFTNYSRCSACHVLGEAVSEHLFFFICFQMLCSNILHVLFYLILSSKVGNGVFTHGQFDMCHLGPIEITFCPKCVSNWSFWHKCGILDMF